MNIAKFLSIKVVYAHIRVTANADSIHSLHSTLLKHENKHHKHQKDFKNNCILGKSSLATIVYVFSLQTAILIQ